MIRFAVFLMMSVFGVILLGGCASVGTRTTLAGVPYRVVATSLQPVGLGERDWLVQVASQLMAWTRVSGEEACGEIGVNPVTGQHSLVMITNGAQIGCLLRPNLRLSGTHDAGWSLHSHPLHDCIRFGWRDQRLLTIEGGTLSDVRSSCGDVSVFSRDDITTGPGYLASRGRLLSQHGTGTTAVVDPHLPVVADTWPSWRAAGALKPQSLMGSDHRLHGRS